MKLQSPTQSVNRAYIAVNDDEPPLAPLPPCGGVQESGLATQGHSIGWGDAEGGLLAPHQI
jgi:hypothetical protein